MSGMIDDRHRVLALALAEAGVAGDCILDDLVPELCWERLRGDGLVGSRILDGESVTCLTAEGHAWLVARLT